MEGGAIFLVFIAAILVFCVIDGNRSKKERNSQQPQNGDKKDE